MKTAVVLALVLVLAAGALAACGGDGNGDGVGAGDGGTPSATTRATRPRIASTSNELPAPLAANLDDADEIVGVGTRDLRARLAKLEGHPVVVNVWASWCGPCRHEFPFFAQAVRKHIAEVAFVGIDIMDDRDAAARFLDEKPPGFPSVFDPDGKAARSLRGGGRGVPTTFFVGADGDVVYTNIGGYPDAASLEADIQSYALGRS